MYLRHSRESDKIVLDVNSDLPSGNSQKDAVSVSTAQPVPKEVTGASNVSVPELRQQKIDSLHIALNTWTNQIQRPIEFYGKVVDDHAQPVKGATIFLTWGQIASENSFQTNIVSDSEGLFAIEELTGSFLDVRVEKDGYYSLKGNQVRFMYWAITGATPFEPDKGRPVIFTLRKKGVGAKLISASLRVKMPRDGTPVNVDLSARSYGASGPLQMSQIKPTYQTWKKATDWAFRICIPDGGFVEESEEFPFEAPESGYESNIKFKFQKEQTNWAEGIYKSYYIKFGNPPCYGQIKVQTDISEGGAEITYTVNPDGSLNLEPN